MAIDTASIGKQIAWNVEFVGSHDDRFSLPSIDPVDRPGNFAEVEQVAAAARRMIGLNTTDPLFNLSETFSRFGLLSFSLDMGANSADAASILLPSGGVAVVNGSLRVGRRRLALAHEFGHYLFADEYTVDWRIDDKEDGYAWESRIDRFARALLLPVEGLDSFWKSLRLSGDSLRTTAVKTASRFRVDMATLARRVRELKLAGKPSQPK